jgi:transcriptional regulator with XRE-family HTH domain
MTNSDTSAPDMLTRDRLRALMESKGLTPTRLSIDAGLGPTYVKDVLGGKIKAMRTSSARKIAEVLGVQLAEMFEEMPPEMRRQKLDSPPEDFATMPVIGAAETGVVRRDGASIILRRNRVIGAPHPRFSSAAIEVRDISMDQSQPHAFALGCLALVAWPAPTIPVYHGMIALIRVVHEHGIELLIRRVTFAKDRINLVAESSKPDRYPVISVEKLGTDQSEKIYVMGEVYCSLGFQPCYPA